MLSLKLNITSQKLFLHKDNNLLQEYLVSTGAKGVGEQKDSGKTPRGKHIIRAKIGAGCLPDTVFVGRRPTGELYSKELREKYPDRDWILTRILWLSGIEVGRNRLGNVDTMRRYIYIHGSPDDVTMGIPGSHGCIRMRNADILELFTIIHVGASLLVEEE